MTQKQRQLIVLSLALTSVGTLGGWAQIQKVAGPAASVSFLMWGTGIGASIVSLQCVLSILSAKRLFYELLSGVAFGLSLVWFTLCLFLPIFWIGEVGVAVKLVLICASCALLASNLQRAHQHFEHRWHESGEHAFAGSCSWKSAAIDWDSVTKAMALSISLYVPGVPERLNSILSVLVVVSMTASLNVRHLFPTLSMIAWGVSTAILASMVVQLAGLGIAQACKVYEIEARYGRKLRNASAMVADD